MNAHEISERLAANAAAVAEHLLPRGKKSAGEWKAGSVAGEEGQSLSVRISGAKKGRWKDFATDDGGDLLDLWAATRSMGIGEALVEAKAYLGIRDEMPARDRPAYKRPGKPACQTPKSAVREWLHSRGITDDTIAAFKIGEQLRDGKAYAVFPYFRDGELVNVKYRNAAEKRDMRQEGGAEPCLFGWHLIDPRARSVAITEGEIDAMTLHQAGIPALSVNAGAGNHQWIENDWERLERFSEILVCFDDDDAGQKGAREVLQRLGLERCKPVKFGAKDANQWLMDGAGGEDFHAACKDAKPLDPDELVSMAGFVTEAKAILHPTAQASAQRDPVFFIGGRYRNELEFRKREVSLWTGINGHGKSLALNQVMLGLMHQGERCCVFSGEMQPVIQATRLIKQATGTGRPTPAYIDATAEWVRDRMWVFNVVGNATIARLLEVFRYGAKRYGISQFVIDSLMKTDVPADGPGFITAQNKAMNAITEFCSAHGAHVHLVAHPRKLKDESEAPGKMDVAGSGSLSNMVDNVFSVWSARRDEDAEDTGKPDAMIELHKQRNGEAQHKKFYLWFDRASQQFCGSAERRATSYVPFDGAAPFVSEEAA